VISFFFIVPVLWIFNSGIKGCIPIYATIFSAMAAVLVSGFGRIMAIFALLVITNTLILLEYKYPSLFPAYTSDVSRYIDFAIALITAIVANTFLLGLILNQYNKERIKLTESQSNLIYLSFHDTLTGLYNRTHFELAIKNFPHSQDVGIGVFVADIDGLKFVNDTFGHEQGDLLLIRAARVLQASFRAHDAVSRVGGDEFIILLHDISEHDMEAIYGRIRVNIRHENEKTALGFIPLKMSIGFAYSANGNRLIQELLREADNKMYRQKISHYADGEGSMIQTVKQMLTIRDHTTGCHTDRLKNLISDFARSAGVAPSEMDDLNLLAEFHDIGKVGISDQILNKPGALTPEEKVEMQKHSEIGYRIAQASTEMRPIADWVLKHHEWWNGKGYPLGITGEAIPLPCRILAIVDAYDAMINDRPYRKALDKSDAVAELKSCAGTQFDPQLIELFVSLVENDERQTGT
jgi:diguanylate cyclase (GGDEF)-like protein